MVDRKLNAAPDKLAYSIDETRRLVGVGRTSIFKAVRAHQLPIAKCRSRTLILTDDLKGGSNRFELIRTSMIWVVEV